MANNKLIALILLVVGVTLIYSGWTNRNPITLVKSIITTQTVPPPNVIAAPFPIVNPNPIPIIGTGLEKAWPALKQPLQ